MNAIITYITELSRNNNREWFHANKGMYNEAMVLFEGEIQKIIDLLHLLDPRLSDLKAKDVIFRIFRDIRFSNDKTPYKTHFSAYLARGGRKSTEAGYYLHIGVDESFLAAGVHSPQKEELKAIREEILYRPEEIKKIIDAKLNDGFTLYEEDKLKTGPKDFPKDSPAIELLKHRHFLLTRELTMDEILSERFPEIVTRHFENLIPFTYYLNNALTFKGNE